ncbi:DUF2059 domain-containing protein [Paracoccaceae bacterium]
MGLRVLGLSVALALAVAPPAVRAETAPLAVPAGPSVQALSDALLIGDVMAVLREEGLANAAELAADFPAGGNAGWQAAVEAIYAPDAMRAAFDAALSRELSTAPGAVEAALAFFSSEGGHKALRLVIEARRALLDPAVEAAAKQRWSVMEADDSRRAAALHRFAEVNSLIEANVMGALNANLAFFQGMAEAGGPLGEMTEQDMLSMVWGSEPEVRTSTTDWLMPFLAMAYEPLSDGELEAYIAFSDIPEGRRVNAAVFAAFDALFLDISRRLGRTVGREMIGQDI